ncbi:MAG TPA: hypothetical protein VGK53_12485 [Propionicimonas sp.]
MLRSLIAAAALAILAGANPAGVAGDFGASLSPVPLVWEQAQTINVANKGDVPIVATLTIDGKGWEIEASTLSLDPGARQAVRVTKAGQDDAVLRLSVVPSASQTAMDDVAIVLEGKLRHQNWTDTLDLGLVGVLAVVFILGVLVIRAAYRSKVRQHR